MSKPKIIQKLKIRNSNIGKKELEKIFDIFFQQISDALQDMRSIEIRSLGTFFIKEIEKKNKREILELEKLFMFQKEIKLDLGLAKGLKK